jgi:hypothetical protein
LVAISLDLFLVILLDWLVVILDWLVVILLVCLVVILLDWLVAILLDLFLVILLDWLVVISLDWLVVISLDWLVVILLEILERTAFSVTSAQQKYHTQTVSTNGTRIVGHRVHTVTFACHVCHKMKWQAVEC